MSKIKVGDKVRLSSAWGKATGDVVAVLGDWAWVKWAVPGPPITYAREKLEVVPREYQVGDRVRLPKGRWLGECVVVAIAFDAEGQPAYWLESKSSLTFPTARRDELEPV